MAERTCTIDACSNRLVARGWCSKHYMRWKRHGDPTHVERIRGADHARFMSYVDASGGLEACHEWTGGRDHKGYGRFQVGDDPQPSHRWLLGYLRGMPLSDDEQACHHCDTPPCVNPKHLYVGDAFTNAQDRVERGQHRNNAAMKHRQKTHCPQGHPYSGDNLYLRPQGRGRGCRECARVSSRLSIRRKRSKS